MSTTASDTARRPMNRWRAALQPSLVRRSAVAVLLAFVLVWAALLAYLYLERVRVRVQDPGLQRFAGALQASMVHLRTRDQAVAFVDASATWLNIRRREFGRLPGAFEFELLDRDGVRIHATGGLASDRLPAITRPLHQIELRGTRYVLAQARTPQWTLNIAEPVRSDSAFLAYNGAALLPYLGIALPLVLLAIWLPIRSGLRPLQELADRIAARDAADLRPVGVAARHRELVPLVDALDALLARLRGQLERERAFVQDAAHEIRTPLAVINAQAHVLAQATDAGQRAQAEAELNLAIARTSHLAQQLLDLAALDRAGTAQTSRIDLAHWMRTLLGHAAQAALREGRELSLDAPDTLHGRIDLPAMESIVRNLVDNALQHGMPGSSIAVSLHTEDAHLLVEVRDDGPGIPAAQRAHAFERFHRGGEARASGAGLGLSIVRQAALRLGGGVDIVEGLQGRGVGFRVRLPWAAA